MVLPDPATGAGTTVISDSVVAKVAGIAAHEVEGVHALGGGAARALGAIREAIGSADVGQGISVEVVDGQVAVDVTIVAEYPVPLPQVAAEVRTRVTAAIEELVGLKVTVVNVMISDVHHSGAPAPDSRKHPEPPGRTRESEIAMSASDKIKNAAEDLKGKANEAVGKATHDDSQVAKGRAEQASASVKKAGENIKDAVTD